MPDVSDPRRNLKPILGSGDSWEPFTTEFKCDRCGSVACTLTLLPPFATDPQLPFLGTPGSIPGEEMLGADDLRLSIDGPVKLTHSLLPSSGVDVAGIDAALRTGDADALYSIDPEFAPFLCPSCGKRYCAGCWTVWVDFDDGFYDCTRGRCPGGHVRVMDD